MSRTGRDGEEGRPTKLTEDRIATILDFVRAGNTYVVSAKAAGISESSFHRYRQIGEAAIRWIEQHGTDEFEDEPDDAELWNPWERHHDDTIAASMTLVEGLDLAEAEGEVMLVTRWAQAAKDDWRAARDLLARRHPDRWSEQSQIGIVGAEGGPLELSLDGPPSIHVEDLGAVVAGLIEAGAVGPAKEDVEGST